MAQPTKFGVEFLTYVLWAVSPEGRAVNLGELQTDKNGKGELEVSAQMPVFSLLATAEPYFAVRQPSELVVLENEIRKNTKGKLFVVDDYKLLTKAHYQKLGNPLALSLDLKNTPLEMYQARNAVDIAKMRGAEKYAAGIFMKAEASLKIAENALARKANKREMVSTARQTVQFSEDARALAVQRQDEERTANERKAAEEAQRLARERAEQQERQRIEAEAAKAKAEAARAIAEAERAKAEAAQAQALLQQQQATPLAEQEALRRAEADAARATAEAERQKAEAERQKALQQEEAARKAAEDAERARKQAEEEKAQLRARLLQQFNQVLETRDTDRGLVVNMSDVLFDTAKYTLRPEAREKLARIAGIVLNYPGLRLESEGHTDNVGSVEYNQKLSEQRADSVRQYLYLRESRRRRPGRLEGAFRCPWPPNDTVAGRQKTGVSNSSSRVRSLEQKSEPTDRNLLIGSADSRINAEPEPGVVRLRAQRS